MWDDLSANRDALSLAIKGVLSAAGISTTQVAASLPRRMVTLKYARLPHAEPAQIAAMVPYEAQQYIPFPLDEVVLDHQIVSDPMDEQTVAMIVAVRLPLVEDLMWAFDKAGLEVTRLSVSALALGEHGRVGTVPTAYLDVESGEMDMAVVSAGKLLFSRAASTGGAGGSDGGQRLAMEVARSLSAYQNEYRAQPVSKLVLAGAIEDLKQLEQFLSGLLDVPVERISNATFPASDPDSLLYATAVGVAIEGCGMGANKIDLVPPSRRAKKAAARQKAQVTSVAAVLLLLLFAGGYAFTKNLQTAAQDRAAAVKENSRLDTAKKSLDKSHAEHDQAVRTYNLLISGLGRQKPFVEVLKNLSDAIPSTTGVTLTQFSFERGNVLSIHGSSKTEAAATDLAVAMQGSNAFHDIRLNYVGDTQAETGPASPSGGIAAAAKKATLTSFLITCKVNGADQKLKSDVPSKTNSSSSSSTKSSTERNIQ